MKLGKSPSNKAQLEASRKQTEEAKKREQEAKDQQKITQDQVVKDNKTRRKRAFQRFSLLLLDDSNTPTDTTVG